MMSSHVITMVLMLIVFPRHGYVIWIKIVLIILMSKIVVSVNSVTEEEGALRLLLNLFAVGESSFMNNGSNTKDDMALHFSIYCSFVFKVHSNDNFYTFTLELLDPRKQGVLSNCWGPLDLKLTPPANR